jgi:hypothetical protein
MLPSDLPPRLSSKIRQLRNGCWLWQAAVTNTYGRVWYGGRMVYAHRLVYELLVGSIPDDAELDHLCRERRCVNPAHGEIVTARENRRRQGSNNARKTHCPAGHPYNEVNTYRYPDGRRQCRICLRAARKRWRESH